MMMAAASGRVSKALTLAEIPAEFLLVTPCVGAGSGALCGRDSRFPRLVGIPR